MNAQGFYFCWTRHAEHGTFEKEAVFRELIPIANYFTYQEEVCPDTGRPHLQGYVVLKSKMRRSTFVGKFKCHAARRNGTHEQARDYCQKAESRKAGTQFFEHGIQPTSRAGARTDIAEFATAILSGASDYTLLEEFPQQVAKYPQFIQHARHTKLQHEVMRERPAFVPRLGWQFSLAQVLAGCANPRLVLWRWDRIGNVGKSHFARTWKPESSFIVTGGKHTDIMYAFNFQPVVFFDWSRCQENTFPYGLVESFKNGYFLSTKYQSRATHFRIPHVVVFANFAPDVSQMSLDRWDIEEVF